MLLIIIAALYDIYKKLFTQN